MIDAGAPDVPTDLVAREVTLSGKAALRRDETWSLSDVRVASDAAAFGLSGSGKGADRQVRSSGRAAAAPALYLRTCRRHHRVLDHRAASGRLRRRQPHAASGDVAGQPLSLAGRFDRDAAGGIVVPSFEGHWASAVLAVADLAITRERTSGSARLKVARLQDVGALLGTDLAGAIEAEVTTDPQLAAARLQARVNGTGIRSGGIAAGALQIDATIDDPMGTATTDARFTASGLAGAADIGRLSGTAKGDRQSGFDVALQASGASHRRHPRGQGRAAGRRDPHRPFAFRRSSPGNPRGPRTRRHGCASPVRRSGSIPRPCAWAAAGFRCRACSILQTVISRLDLAALPLSLVDTFAPGTGLDGTLQAQLRVAGPMASPRIDATYTASSVRLRRREAALLPALGVQGSASLDGRQASIDARLSAGTGSSLSLKGKGTTAPLAGTGALTGSIDIAPFAPLLGNQVRNIAGTVRSDLDVRGQRDEDHRHRFARFFQRRARFSRDGPALERRHGARGAAG